MTVADITHPDDLRDDAVNLAEVRAGVVSQHRVVKRYLHADGDARPRRGVRRERAHRGGRALLRRRARAAGDERAERRP